MSDKGKLPSFTIKWKKLQEERLRRDLPPWTDGHEIDLAQDAQQELARAAYTAYKMRVQVFLQGKQAGSFLVCVTQQLVVVLSVRLAYHNLCICQTMPSSLSHLSEFANVIDIHR